MKVFYLFIAVVVLTAVFISGQAMADQDVTLKVPDSFTKADIDYVKEGASVFIQRVLERPLVPPAEDVEAVKTEIDRVREANGLEKKFDGEAVIR